MSANYSNSQAEESTEVQCKDRWQVYRRLQELEIPCWCYAYKPLKVQVSSPQVTVQLWSVIRHVSLPRQELALWLEHCWQICSFRGQ